MRLEPNTPAVRRASVADAARCNAIVNHPEVRPHLGASAAGPLDLTAFISEPLNVALLSDHACVLFAHDEPGRYEQHTAILPEGRGAAVLPMIAEAYRHLFVLTDCIEVVTKIPEENRRADLMARRAGFVPIFTAANVWAGSGQMRFFSLSFDAWRAKDPTLAEVGHAFHDAVEDAKSAAGVALLPHADDEAHNRAVGAACLIGAAGNEVKAAVTYNRWARLAGYEPARLISQGRTKHTPPLIDVGEFAFVLRPELAVQIHRRAA